MNSSRFNLAGQLAGRLLRSLTWLALALVMVLTACRDGVTRTSVDNGETDIAAHETPASVLVPPSVPAGYVHARRGTIEIVYSPDISAQVESSLANVAQDALAIATQLGLENTGELEVRLVSDANVMRALAPAAAPPPSYAVGVAYPQVGLALVTSRAPGTWEAVDVRRVLRHELSHLLLDRATGHARIPRWFSEGMAIFQSGESSFDRFQTLAVATFMGRIVPLADLDRAFADGGGRVDLAYAQSTDVVSFMIDREGIERMQIFLRHLREGADFDLSLHQTWGISLVQLSDAWTSHAKSRFMTAPLWAGGGVLWFLGAMLMVFAYFRRRSRAKETIARWEREERAADEAATREHQRRMRWLEAHRLSPVDADDPVESSNDLPPSPARRESSETAPNEPSSVDGTNRSREPNDTRDPSDSNEASDPNGSRSAASDRRNDPNTIKPRLFIVRATNDTRSDQDSDPLRWN